jgi:hypothetical protein
MQTPWYVLLFVLSALAPGNVFAIVGEKRAQVDARLGAPVDVVGTHAIYEHGGYTVVVAYWSGTSVYENLSRAFVKRKPADPVVVGSKLSDKEVQDMLGIYGAGEPWQRGAGGGWKLPNGRVIAMCQDRQAPVRSHMTPEEATAISKTPSLIVCDVALALAIRRGDESKSSSHAAASSGRQAGSDAPTEAQEIEAAFEQVIGHALNTSAPLYPFFARGSQFQGGGMVRVTFDGAGCVASAKMVQSVGSDTLDSNTIIYAKAYWSGPPNLVVLVPVHYHLIY